MVVAGDHVLGAEINKRDQVHAAGALQERLVSGRDAMSEYLTAEQQQCQADAPVRKHATHGCRVTA